MRIRMLVRLIMHLSLASSFAKALSSSMVPVLKCPACRPVGVGWGWGSRLEVVYLASEQYQLFTLIDSFVETHEEPTWS